jgi:hypothetical protein
MLSLANRSHESASGGPNPSRDLSVGANRSVRIYVFARIVLRERAK